MDYRLCKRCRQNTRINNYSVDFIWDDGEDTITEKDVSWYCPVLHRRVSKDEKKITQECKCFLEHLLLEQTL